MTVEALVFEQPADDGHGQRAVGAWPDRQPAAADHRSPGCRRGSVPDRLRHRTAFCPASAPGDQRALAFERVAGLARCGADKQYEFGIGEIRLAVRHGLQVAEQRAGTGAVGAAAVGAVPDEIQRAIGLLEEAAGEFSRPSLTLDSTAT